jgi:peptidoglycan/LPS O-acetylase OafA/YrhL
LDGVRALAFLMVFGYHYLELPWGWAGVDIFFVLSGFLITGILFDTRDDPHRVRNFYVRRSLRIFPLYYGLFLVLVLLYPVFHWNWNWGWLMWLGYLGNWVEFLYPFLPHAYVDVVSTAHVGSQTFPRVVLFFGHFWTLSIEEQFYLLWPCVVFWIKDRKKLISLCVTCIVTAPILRMMAIHLVWAGVLGGGFTCRFTPLRIDALLLGGLLALVRCGPHARMMPVVARAGFILLSSIIGVWLVLNPGVRFQLHGYPYPVWDATWGLTFVEVLGACLIVMSLEYRSVTFRIFSLRPLRWIGRISYSAYLFHDIPHAMYVRAARHYLVHWRPGAAILAFACTMLMSLASFRWYEAPFIRLKERWSR